MNPKTAILVLADGTVVPGRSIGSDGTVCGELVFNTAMTGYQEILTDPSYARQLVMLTAAHIGNTGCNAEDQESSRAWASGLIIRNESVRTSNYRADTSLVEWLKKNKLVAIADVDTRFLTRHIREHGAMAACITNEYTDATVPLEQIQRFSGLEGVDLAQQVSRQTIERWHLGQGEWGVAAQPQSFHIVAYDFGVKNTILRILHDKGCHITLVPAKTKAAEVLAMQPDGIFLSNGPGDPKACTYAIEAAQAFIESGIPLFGICLGFQIIALACGARSVKMKFGHHGANHPVISLDATRRVFITSQNHGFAIDEQSLPSSLIATHRSLFDHSLQGIRHRDRPVLAFQGHPEAAPGPQDIAVIFDTFMQMLREHQNRGAE
ncbi:MAG: glutamine-hydrolyzing carbamoyl-phosphate synthase small subunit [Legionellaceae bacterium]|nr:glutamine-hydrolyzing carbamoyl-phosphate synthase small subunit [Legionellaceae bacterium]